MPEEYPTADLVSMTHSASFMGADRFIISMEIKPHDTSFEQVRVDVELEQILKAVFEDGGAWFGVDTSHLPGTNPEVLVLRTSDVMASMESSSALTEYEKWKKSHSVADAHPDDDFWADI